MWCGLPASNDSLKLHSSGSILPRHAGGRRGSGELSAIAITDSFAGHALPYQISSCIRCTGWWTFCSMSLMVASNRSWARPLRARAVANSTPFQEQPCPLDCAKRRPRGGARSPRWCAEPPPRGFDRHPRRGRWRHGMWSISNRPHRRLGLRSEDRRCGRGEHHGDSREQGRCTARLRGGRQ